MLSGRVISSSPIGGTLVALGSAVDLVISTGPCGEPIIIQLHPAPATKFVGASKNFFVQAIGGTGPLRYQWYKDGSILIVGATNNQYTINPLALGNAGTYHCRVSDDYKYEDSKAAQLAVVPVGTYPILTVVKNPGASPIGAYIHPHGWLLASCVTSPADVEDKSWADVNNIGLRLAIGAPPGQCYEFNDTVITVPADGNSSPAILDGTGTDADGVTPVTYNVSAYNGAVKGIGHLSGAAADERLYFNDSVLLKDQTATELPKVSGSYYLDNR
ncbi:MAG: hypothetical protein A3B15_00730 [Candidatus Buchananbacteria bacterium RIFCSPLOWO2_01_FULL_45_31]|uniref:Ig-like domain-containing protein n=1 Tax=Candidatus Buchananbacteria bacterium RIFCSPLOWO2_01_FULL_45_31 TaxID=1797545 RepID=A0A1G1YPL5_9BACT|nr:MAG: hypothetical protein A3B15_00730 [Candidatus Buchananbacteria bacterium RIFCSPLOWO2_01_FULL_45_31]